jgi:hypothetical protein
MHFGQISKRATAAHKLCNLDGLYRPIARCSTLRTADLRPEVSPSAKRMVLRQSVSREEHLQTGAARLSGTCKWNQEKSGPTEARLEFRTRNVANRTRRTRSKANKNAARSTKLLNSPPLNGLVAGSNPVGPTSLREATSCPSKLYLTQSSGGVFPAKRSVIQFTAAIVLACAARPCPMPGSMTILTLLPALHSLSI